MEVSRGRHPKRNRTKDGDGMGSYQGAFEVQADVQLKKK
jgi:hypothetical protein